MDKYYGHRHYRIHFMHAKLERQNFRPHPRPGTRLEEAYTREEVEVEYILDSLYAELWQQPSTDVQNVLANSVLEFIWRIADCSICYTTDTYRRKLSLFQVPQAQQSSFDDFVWALLDRNFEQVRRVTVSCSDGPCQENEGYPLTLRSGRGSPRPSEL